MDEEDRSASDEDADESAEPVEGGGDEPIEGGGDEPTADDAGTGVEESSGFADESYDDDIGAGDSADPAGISTERADLNGDEGYLRDRPGESSSQNGADGEKSLVHRFRHDNDGALMWLREMLSSVAIVLVLGLILFGVSGVWPPMVAVESGSMEPNLEVGDLVFVTEPGRFAPDAADNDIGVVTYDAGQSAGYQSFGTYGSVIIFQPPDRVGSPIIHRPMFHVEEGEDWYDRADEEYHQADSCSELRNSPAPHDGYITLGDNNARYDQATGLAEPVKAEWVTGVARLRVPYLGYIRLIATGQAEIGDLVPGHVGVGSASADEMQREDRAVEDTPMESPLITESSMESPLITESPIKNRSSEGSFVGDDGQSGPIAAMETTGGAGMDGPTAVAS